MTIISTDLPELYSGHLAQMQQQYIDAAILSGCTGVLIAAGTLQPCFLDDHHYPFVVNPHFKAWLPILDVPDSFLLIRHGERPRLLFSQPEDYWHMTPALPQAFWADHWQIEPIQSYRDVLRLIGNTQDLLFIGEQAELAKEWGITAINPTSALTSLHYERAAKTAYEIACLRQANQIAVRGHSVAETGFRAGKSEFEIAHDYLGAIQHREQQAPYSAIVAQNEHCAVLHYQFYDQQRHSAANLNSLLIDAGANFHGYAADITRTYAARPGVFQDLLSGLDQHHLGIINDIQTGMNYAELNAKMHHRIAQLLLESDIIRMPVEDMIETNLTFTFLPHGLGHLLGLQTHDVGGFLQSRQGEERPAPEQYPALRLTRDIENQQVFTIEPGLYFIPMLLKKLKQSPHQSQVNWPLIDALMPYGGIRIEDNVVILNDQPVNLTRLAMAEHRSA